MINPLICTCTGTYLSEHLTYQSRHVDIPKQTCWCTWSDIDVHDMLVYLTCWRSWADMSMYLTCRRIWHVDIFDMLTYMSWHVNVPELTCWRSGSCTPWGLAWSMCSLPWMFFRFPRDRPPLLGWRIGRGQSPDTGSGPCPRWEQSAWRTAHCKEEGRNITYTVYVLVLNKLCWSQSKGLLTFEKKKTN